MTSANGVCVGEVDRDKITIEATGHRVNLKGELYGDVNFYIRQSRRYFPQRKLRTFVYFYYSHIVYLVLFGISFFCWVFFAVGLALAGLNFLFLLMYCQHLHVLLHTMRYVLKQPSVPNNSMTLTNDHIVISVEVFRARFAATDNAGIGLAVQGSGQIKLQVFKKSAMTKMKSATILSACLFVASALMTVICLTVGIVRLIYHYR